MKKHSKISAAVQNALNTIEVCQQRLAVFHYAIKGIKDRDNTPEIQNAVHAINSILYRNLNDAYAALFMWGCVAPEKAHREARKAAFRHFLTEHSSIVQYLHLDFKTPGMWQTEEMDEFRAEIEAERKKDSKSRGNIHDTDLDHHAR